MALELTLTFALDQYRPASLNLYSQTILYRRYKVTLCRIVTKFEHQTVTILGGEQLLSIVHFRSPPLTSKWKQVHTIDFYTLFHNLLVAKYQIRPFSGN